MRSAGFVPDVVERVWMRLEGTHWQRNLTPVAMHSATTIGECYLQPVDYRAGDGDGMEREVRPRRGGLSPGSGPAGA
jgi:hypothetical protein